MFEFFVFATCEMKGKKRKEKAEVFAMQKEAAWYNDSIDKLIKLYNLSAQPLQRGCLNLVLYNSSSMPTSSTT